MALAVVGCLPSVGTGSDRGRIVKTRERDRALGKAGACWRLRVPCTMHIVETQDDKMPTRGEKCGHMMRLNTRLPRATKAVLQSYFRVVQSTGSS